MHKITAVTVSTDYHDVLPQVLKHNHRFFSKWYVVTKTSDKKTRDMCAAYSNVRVLFCDFSANNAVFNKGLAIRIGQQYAKKEFPNHTRLILDSDIIIPNNFLETVSKHEIEEDCIYGAQRVIFSNPLDFPRDGVLEKKFKNENIVIGYFQMYKSDFYYPDSKNCAWVDVDFYNLFKKSKYFDFHVAHLGPINTNHNGKKGTPGGN